MVIPKKNLQRIFSVALSMNEEQKLPQCIGFIMDGNRRWAKEQGLDTYAGHYRGHEVFNECVSWLVERKIPHGVFYAFSTENWNRSEHEVGYLMKLFRGLFTDMRKTIEEQHVRIRIVGCREDFAKDIQEQMTALERESMKYTDTTIWIALSYGGRVEIIAAVNEAVRQGEAVDEQSFQSLLWSAGMPDPDIIVRTSGEQRLSGFMTWSSVYSELYFIEKHWPALAQADFDDILTEYGKRQRRRGR